MAIRKTTILDNDMAALKEALLATGFFEGYTIDIDIDWDNITTVTTSSGSGDEHTVYVADNGVLMLYENDTWQPTDTKVTYTSAVSLTSHPTSLRIKDSDGHVVFRIQNDPYTNSVSKGSIRYETYYTTGSKVGYIGMMTGYYVAQYSTYVDYILSCTNGIILYITNSSAGKAYSVPIRIVKNNDGKLVFVSYANTAAQPSTQIPSGYPSESGGFCNDLNCITYADSDPINQFLCSTQYGLHYAVIPMLTNSGTDSLSYTEKSGFLPYSTRDLTIKTIVIGGNKYITDSFFAILDED